MADDKKPGASDNSKTSSRTDVSTDKPSARASSAPVKKAAPKKKTAQKKTAQKKAVPEETTAAVLTSQERKDAETIIKRKMSVAEEKKALDAIITGASTVEEKKKAIDELKKMHVADDIIKKRTTEIPEGVKQIKQKASAAKLAASEKILSQSYVADADVALSRLADTFDKSARRWEMVVYPTMFAFILLAGYGFYLIYHLTHDIAVLSRSVTRMATIVSDATPKVTSDMRDMSQDMRSMSGEIRTMSYQMETLKPMSNNMAHMTQTISNMNRSVYGMQRDMSGLNRTMSGGPFGFMNDMMPFTSDSYSTPPPPLPRTAGQPVYIRPMPSPPMPAPTRNR